jgi:hypothetical protein
MLTAGIFGILLGRAGKPYGKVKLFIHLFFFVWLAVGFGFIFAVTIKAMTPTLVPVAIMGLTILTQLVVGTLMLASKKAGKALQTIHISSAILMVLSDICAFIITGLRS